MPSNHPPSSVIQQLSKWLIPTVGLGLLLVHGFTDVVKPNNLVFEVNRLGRATIFETPHLYLWMHLCTIIPILSLSFDRKVAFFKTWRVLFPTLLIVAVPYWIWDVAKTSAQMIWVSCV